MAGTGISKPSLLQEIRCHCMPDTFARSPSRLTVQRFAIWGDPRPRPQLMSKHRVLSFKPQLRPEWRGQDGQSETKQPDHSASLGDSITSSTRIRFSVHTGNGIRVDQILREAWFGKYECHNKTYLPK
jgi:hypothetical protein